MLAWIGVALLSVSWLLGLSYYHQSRWTAWGICVVAGAALLAGRAERMPGRLASAVALGLSVPAVWLAPWPYRAGVLLWVVGLGLHVLPLLRRVGRPVCTAGLLAGGVLMVQSLAMFAYEAATARSHELPGPLSQLLGAVAGVLGIEAAAQDTTLTLHSMRTQHFFGATWEMLLDPATLCFVAGGIVLLCWRHGLSAGRRPAWRLARSLTAFVLLIAAWLPARAGLLMAVYLHDVLRTDYDAPLDSMKLFWNPWLHLALLAGPVLLAWRFSPGAGVGGHDATPEQAQNPGPGKWRAVLAASLVWAAAVLLTLAAFWDPVGRRGGGRVVVEEYHPQTDKVWERTDKPFDTNWYGHLSGYNYYCIYDYCCRYYSMSRLTRRIDDDALEACDVLVIKVPTRPYSPEEIDAVRRFVQRGGGLLLIGEHTNVFGTGTYLNSIARVFGFRFRYDCLFGIDSVFEQRYETPLVPHPIVQHLPPLDFATSCSIDPGRSSGRAVIRATGLKNLMADYHVDNFYPRPEDRAEMRYGAFIQLWSTRYGRGRVVAFTDSTIFSNFATFEPGKIELMLGMIEWLNHSSNSGDPRPWLGAGGLLALLGGLLASRASGGVWPVLVASGLLGWVVASVGARAAHRAGMPPPPAVRSKVDVVMDRTISGVTLPRNGFIAGKEDGFGIFERWVLRLGYFTSRRQGRDVFRGDLVVFLYPSKPVDERFRQNLADYVAGGGKVLVVDSPENVRSTGNDLLQPFGLAGGPTVAESGPLTTSEGLPSVLVETARVVNGGRPFAWLCGQPVGTSLRHGRGLVTVIGFGSRFSDASMGVTGDVIPDEELKQVFELQYSMLRAIIAPQSSAEP